MLLKQLKRKGFILVYSPRGIESSMARKARRQMFEADREQEVGWGPQGVGHLHPNGPTNTSLPGDHLMIRDILHSQ